MMFGSGFASFVNTNRNYFIHYLMLKNSVSAQLLLIKNYNVSMNVHSGRFISLPEKKKELVETEIKHFKNALQAVELDMKKLIPIPSVADNFIEFLHYNIPSTRNFRRMKVFMFLYYSFVPEALEDNEKKKQLYSVAWLAEMVHILFLLIDDIQDNSKMRFGNECWYCNHLESFTSDIFLFQTCIRKLLKQYVENTYMFEKISNLFEEVIFQTLVYQTADYQAKKLFKDESIVGLYDRILIRKNVYLISLFWNTPFYLAGYDVIPYQEQMCDLAVKFAKLIQMKNDISDLPNTLNAGKGKNEDIADGSFTWCLDRALRDSSNEQKKIIKEYYGRKDNLSIQKICKIYSDLGILEKFQTEVNSFIEKITMDINAIPDETIRNFFKFLLNSSLTYGKI